MEKNPDDEDDDDTKLTLGDWIIYPVMVPRSIFEGYPALNMYEEQRVIRRRRCRMSFWCSDALVFQATKSKLIVSGEILRKDLTSFGCLKRLFWVQDAYNHLDIE